jgi:hypothetical protein
LFIERCFELRATVAACEVKMAVFDVVLHHVKTDNPSPAGFPASQQPPVDRFNIGERWWVGKLSCDAAQLVFETCRPGRYGFERPNLCCEQLHVFGAEVPPPASANKERWDDDGTLQTLVALSRLVHPTSASLRLAARIELDAAGIVKWISQARFSGVQLDAFIAPGNPRDWLTSQELETLKTIAFVLDGRLSLGRVWRALWYHEYAARSYEMDIRWPMVVTGLEALLKTERNYLGDQFRRRTFALAKELGVVEYTEKQASDAWEMRCGLTHGQNLRTVTGEDLRLYVMIESILRMGALKALREQEFGALFENDAAIRSRWPRS